MTLVYYRSVKGLHRAPVDYLALGVHVLVHIVVAVAVAVAVVLVTGILMMDRAINIFDLLLIPQPLTSSEIIELFFTIHILACMVLAQ